MYLKSFFSYQFFQQILERKTEEIDSNHNNIYNLCSKNNQINGVVRKTQFWLKSPTFKIVYH